MIVSSCVIINFYGPGGKSERAGEGESGRGGERERERERGRAREGEKEIYFSLSHVFPLSPSPTLPLSLFPLPRS
jgi:hypothetical protein